MDAQYSPAATVADIEIMQNVSRRTAERLMRQFKKECGIPKYKRPTLRDLKNWFGKS